MALLGQLKGLPSLALPLLWSLILPPVEASVGDSNEYYRRCVNAPHCSTDKCTNDWSYVDSIANALTDWTCKDECAYRCMWLTTREFTLAGRGVPQFYGKWPFTRLLYMQEPASVLFSLLNLIAFLFLLKTVWKQTTREWYMRPFWWIYGTCGSLTWLCSIVFHIRDTPLTEKLDYFSATGSVLVSLLCSVARIKGNSRVFATCGLHLPIHVLGLPFTIFYAYHVYYLSTKLFDYEYNLQVNIIVGMLNSLVWLLWAFGQWRRGPSYRYVIDAVAVVVSACFLLLFEVYDFPPIFWIFDAHSLWHLGTSPLPLLLARFIRRDCEMALGTGAFKRL